LWRDVVKNSKLLYTTHEPFRLLHYFKTLLHFNGEMVTFNKENKISENVSPFSQDQSGGSCTRYMIWKREKASVLPNMQPL
jgi:hypothetical protein